MHSWVFRNRDRLRVIYGRVESEPQAALQKRKASTDAGQIVRRRAWVVLRPMPRRAV